MNPRRRLMLSLVTTLSTTLSACGFQLRGTFTMPFTRIWIGFSTGSALGNELRRILTSSNPGVRIVERREDAELALIVHRESRDRVVIALSTTGTAREYQLLHRLTFEIQGIQGRELASRQDIVLKRDVTSTDAQVVAKEREDELMYREMQSDLVQQLLRRLSSLPAR
jgi:LPS-assembly lipoprotein